MIHWIFHKVACQVEQRAHLTLVAGLLILKSLPRSVGVAITTASASTLLMVFARSFTCQKHQRRLSFRQLNRSGV